MHAARRSQTRRQNKKCFRRSNHTQGAIESQVYAPSCPLCRLRRQRCYDEWAAFSLFRLREAAVHACECECVCCRFTACHRGIQLLPFSLVAFSLFRLSVLAHICGPKTTFPVKCVGQHGAARHSTAQKSKADRIRMQIRERVCLRHLRDTGERLACAAQISKRKR